MNLSVFQTIPALTRDRIYGVFVLVGIILGAVQVAYAAIPDNGGQPDWLTVALVVYAYLGTALGLVAKSNVTSLSGPPPAPNDPPAPGQQEGGETRVWTLVGLLVVVILVVYLITVLF